MCKISWTGNMLYILHDMHILHLASTSLPKHCFFITSSQNPVSNVSIDIDNDLTHVKFATR